MATSKFILNNYLKKKSKLVKLWLPTNHFDLKSFKILLKKYRPSIKLKKSGLSLFSVISGLISSQCRLRCIETISTFPQAEI